MFTFDQVFLLWKWQHSQKIFQHSCVIKIVEPQAHASLEDLKAVVLKVNILEEKKCIPPWNEDQTPEEIVSQAPEPGYLWLLHVHYFLHCIMLVCHCILKPELIALKSFSFYFAVISILL